MARQPDSGALKAMNGSEGPIGSHAEEAFERDMAMAETPQEAAWAVVKFAKAYHGEQASHEAVSPYGGEDITVISAETLAYSRIGDLSGHPACAGMDRLTLCKALYAEMEKAGVDTPETKGVIQSYEAKARVAAGEIPPFFCKEVERYEAAEAKADGIARQELEAVHKEGAAAYREAEAGLEKLEHRGLGLYKRLFPRRYEAQKTALEDKKQAAEKQKSATLEEVKAERMPPPPHLLETPEGFLPVHSMEELRESASRIHKEISSPGARGDYLMACALTGRKPVLVPEKGSALTERPSVRMALTRMESFPHAREQRAVSAPAQGPER